MNALVATVTLYKVPAETDADKSCSNSTSDHDTDDAVTKVVAEVVPSPESNSVPVAESFTEYPNLPAP